MSYVYLFINAIVVALMAMYVYLYEKERGIGDISDTHDTSRSAEDIKATTAMLVVALMVLYVYVNERRMRKISTELNHDRTDLKSTKNAVERVNVTMISTIDQINILSKEKTEKDNAHREETDQIKRDVNAFCGELDQIKK
ncbi:hypothetical protein AM593_05327, partial [Mytilus galloprovincialis]